MSSAPQHLSCPQCGSKDISCDSEGACLCAKGHAFWDTNSPEWQALRKGDRIGPFTFGGDMDTGEGDPFGLHDQVMGVLLEDTARQIREHGQCGVITGEEICLHDRPCPAHEQERHEARELSLFDRFIGLFRRA